jgi:hypothetical protein
MSNLSMFLILVALLLGGLFAIWFLLKAKLRRYLELDSLLEGVRGEARALVLELNETADRNVSLVEDRILSLRQLLDEVDRRIGVEKRETETRKTEREVYAQLNRRRPIVPEASRTSAPDVARPMSSPPPAAPAKAEEQPITLNLGSPVLKAEEGLAYPPQRQDSARAIPEIHLSEERISTARSMREQALDLHRRGISADLIAARLGATVAEIELLVEIEERRQAGAGGSP